MTKKRLFFLDSNRQSLLQDIFLTPSKLPLRLAVSLNDGIKVSYCLKPSNICLNILASVFFYGIIGYLSQRKLDAGFKPCPLPTSFSTFKRTFPKGIYVCTRCSSFLKSCIFA